MKFKISPVGIKVAEDSSEVNGFVQLFILFIGEIRIRISIEDSTNDFTRRQPLKNLAQFRKGLVGIALGTFLIFSVASQAAAVSIVVQDTTVEFISAASILHTFYNSQAGFASSLLPDASLVTGLDLSGVDLFVGYVPSGAYAGSEIASLSAFLAGGSAILFMGESGNPFFDPTNDAINAALSALGSSMASTKTTVDSGFNNATVGNGQVLANALTVGVNTINYASVSGISGGNALFLTTDLATTWAGVDWVGGGDIVFVADSVLLDNLELATNDNDQFFLNVANKAVPEPSTMLLLGFGLAGLGLIRRRRITLRKVSSRRGSCCSWPHGFFCEEGQG